MRKLIREDLVELHFSKCGTGMVFANVSVRCSHCGMGRGEAGAPVRSRQRATELVLNHLEEEGWMAGAQGPICPRCIRLKETPRCLD